MSDKKKDAVKGRDEMNIVEFPIALLRQENYKKDEKSIEYSDYIRGKNGKPVKRKWTITANAKYGWPTASAEDTLIVLFEITKEFNNFSDREIHFTRKNILEKMRCQQTKHYYERLEHDLECLSGIRIKAENAFWDNEKKEYATVVSFGIINNYTFFDERKGKSEQSEFPFSFFRWDDIFFESLQAGYIKELDTNFYFSLDYPLTKKLFRLLDKRRYFKNIIDFDLKTLAYEKLGMSRGYNKGQIARYLDRSHEELIKKGFLKNYDYEKDYDDIYDQKRWRIYYYLEPTQEIVNSAGSEKTLRSLLISKGIGKNKAKRLIEDYSSELIKKQLEYFSHLEMTKSHLISKNPAGFLIKSIQENFSEPHSLKEQREKQALENQKKQNKLKKQQKLKKEDQKFKRKNTRYNKQFSSLNKTEQKKIIAEAIVRLERENNFIYRKYLKRRDEEIKLEEMADLIKQPIIDLRNKILDEMYS